MTTLRLCTASNDADVTDSTAIDQLLDEWEFMESPHGDALTVTVDETITFEGYCEFRPYQSTAVDHPDQRLEAVAAEKFLTQLAPHLSEDLVIQTVGFEYAEFPFINSVFLVNSESTEVTITGLSELEETHLGEAVDSPYR